MNCIIPKCGASADGLLGLLRGGDKEPMQIPLCERCYEALFTAKVSELPPIKKKRVWRSPMTLRNVQVVNDYTSADYILQLLFKYKTRENVASWSIPCGVKPHELSDVMRKFADAIEAKVR